MNSLTKLCRWIIPCSDKRGDDTPTRPAQVANAHSPIPPITPTTPAALLSDEELQFILNLYK